MRRTIAVAACLFAIGCGRSPAPKPLVPAAAAKPPNPIREITAARDAFRKVTQYSLETSRTTSLGEFTQLTEVDCDARYYHHRYTKELTAQGIASGTTQMQGRPRAHQEEERLFVDGASYHRYSGGFENPAPGTDDARPEWGPSLNSWDPTEECAAYRQANGIPFLPFEKILSAKVTFEETIGTGDERCHQFKAVYPDLVESDTMTSSTAPDGSTLSYRKEEMKPVESTLCIGAEDHLPWTVEKGGATYTFSYGDFSRLRMAKF